MIRIERGALTDAEVEAVLRPVNSDLMAMTAAGRAVDLRAGSDVEERLRRFGGLPVGGALVTPAGELPASFLIHVVVQSAEEPVTEAGVRRALLNGLRRATEWGVRDLALPPVGTGAGNLDAEAAARVMIPLIRDHLVRNERPVEVIIRVESEYEEETFRSLVGSAGKPPSLDDEPDSIPETLP